MKQITDNDIKKIEELLYRMEYHSPADKTTLLLAVVQKMAIDLHKSNDADTRNASYLIAIRYIDVEFKKKNRNLKNIVRLFTACVQDYSTINEISPIEKDVFEYIVENFVGFWDSTPARGKLVPYLAPFRSMYGEHYSSTYSTTDFENCIPYLGERFWENEND